jgi:hypothetical protein
MSADIGDGLVGLHLGSGLGLRGKREDSCLLPFAEPRQQHDLAIGELERVMIHLKHALVDLAKDRNGVAGMGTKHEGGLILDWCLEREFGTRKYATLMATLEAMSSHHNFRPGQQNKLVSEPPIAAPDDHAHLVEADQRFQDALGQAIAAGGERIEAVEATVQLKRRTKLAR